jgi:hypothetical protein
MDVLVIRCKARRGLQLGGPNEINKVKTITDIRKVQNNLRRRRN